MPLVSVSGVRLSLTVISPIADRPLAGRGGPVRVGAHGEQTPRRSTAPLGYPRRDERSECRRHPGRRPAPSSAPDRCTVVVGRQHVRNGGERASPGRGRARALRRARGCRPVPRGRGGPGRTARTGSFAVSSTSFTRASCPSRCPRRSGTGSSSSTPAVESRFAQHRGEVGGQVGRRQRDQARSSARATTSPSAERRGRRRRRSVPPSPRTCASSRGSATRPPARSATATGSPSRSRRRRWTRRGSSRPSTSATGSPPSAFASWKAATDAAPREPLRLRRRRASALALRGPVLPGGARGRRGRPRAASSTARTSSPWPVETFVGIGVDTEPILDRSDLFARDGKSQHAFCIDIDRDGDVRVLANVEPDRFWADTMLHELGHGAYDIGFDPSLPWLLRSCHLTVTEGIAILMGRLALEAEWLIERRRARCRRRPRRWTRRLRAAQAAELLVFTRWVLVMTNFERALYADPEARPLADVVEARLALSAPHASGGARLRRTGRPSSTSRARRSTTTRISTGTSWPPSSARRSTEVAGGLVGPTGGRVAARRAGLPSRRSPCAGTSCSSRRPASR